MDLHAPYVIKFIPTRVQKINFFFQREIKMIFKGARSMCPKFREIISQRNRKIQIFKWTYSCRLAKVSWTQIQSRSQKTNCWNNVQVSSNVKGSPDQSHYIFFNQCRKESDPTFNDSEIEWWISRSTQNRLKKCHSNSESFHYMSDPTLSDIDFKNKMAESELPLNHHEKLPQNMMLDKRYKSNIRCWWNISIVMIVEYQNLFILSIKIAEDRWMTWTNT